MRQMLKTGLALILYLIASGSAMAGQLGILCVQQQLNELGFDAGRPDGSIGSKTTAAAQAYNDWMALRDPSNVLPPINDANGRFWCEHVAAANPSVASFKVDENPGTLLIQFRGSVPNSLRVRVGAERVNTPDCRMPCPVGNMRERTVRSESPGIAVLSIELPPNATRACVQMMSNKLLINSAELFMNNGTKRSSDKGGDLDAAGHSACSDYKVDAKNANSWVLTIK